MKGIYEKINLGNYNAIENNFKEYLNSVKNYKKNALNGLPKTIKTELENRWKFAFDEWKYPIN